MLTLPGVSNFTPGKPFAKLLVKADPLPGILGVLQSFGRGGPAGTGKSPSRSASSSTKAPSVAAATTAVQKRPRRRSAVITASPSRLDETQIRRARLLGGTSPIVSSASRSLLSASRR